MLVYFQVQATLVLMRERDIINLQVGNANSEHWKCFIFYLVARLLRNIGTLIANEAALLVAFVYTSKACVIV